LGKDLKLCEIQSLLKSWLFIQAALFRLVGQHKKLRTGLGQMALGLRVHAGAKSIEYLLELSPSNDCLAN
jgi:hypothetical protein